MIKRIERDRVIRKRKKVREEEMNREREIQKMGI